MATRTRARGRERGRGHRVEERGVAFRLPVAVKFTALMGTVVVALVIFQGLRNYRQGVEEIESAVNADGIRLVTLVATAFEPFWVRYDEGADRMVRASPEAIREGQDRVTPLLRAFLEDPSVRGGVLDVVLLGEEEMVYSRAVASASYQFSEGDPIDVPEASAVGISVRSVTYGVGRRQIPARRFQKAVVFRGTPVGYAEVCLTAERIQTLRSRLSAGTLYSALLAAVVGAGVCLLVGTIFTRPIRQLARDMRVASTGNLEHKSSVRTSDELGDLARSFNRMTEGLKAAQEAEADRKLLEQELKIATQIQKNLLPARLPKAPGLDVAAYYMAAKEVGGDYYDFLVIDRHRLGIIVADVSGKGVPGSLVMTMTRSLIHLAAAEEASPREALIRVNRILARDMAPGMFVTALYMLLDLRDWSLVVARAGHNEALLVRARDARIEGLRPQGVALGMDREGRLFSQIEEQRVRLEEGDFIVAYTDGIVEGMDPDGGEYGPERFRRLLASCGDKGAEAITNRVLEDLNLHRRGAEQSDDITIVVLRRDTARGAPPRQP